MTYVEWLSVAQTEVEQAVPGAKLSSALAYDAWKRGESPEEFAKAAAISFTPATNGNQAVRSNWMDDSWPLMIVLQVTAHLAGIVGYALTPKGVPSNITGPGMIIISILTMILGFAALGLAIKAVIVRHSVSDQICGWIIIWWNIATFFFALVFLAQL